MFRNNKGFTLVELMVVIVIIGVLAALAIPKFNEASTKAKISEIPTVISSWDHAVCARIAEVGEVPTTTDVLVFEPVPSKWFEFEMTSAGSGATATTTMTGTIQDGRTVGPYTSTTEGVTSVIDAEADITHDVGGFNEKYLPNWVLTAASGS